MEIVTVRRCAELQAVRITSEMLSECPDDAPDWVKYGLVSYSREDLSDGAWLVLEEDGHVDCMNEWDFSADYEVIDEE